MAFIKIKRVHYLLILVLGILVVYAYIFSFISSSYSPYYGDEYFYFKNSESFAKTLSLKASFTYSGNGSKIFETDAHGPAYPVIYGGLSYFFGWKNLTIPLINFGFLLIVLCTLLVRRDSTFENKIFQILIILGSPFVLFYSISFLPELIHIAGAVGLYLLVTNYSKAPSKVNFLFIFLFILAIGIVRSTWFFALFGLAFLPRNFEKGWKTVCFLLGLILPFLMQQYFHEQVPNTFSGIGELIQSGNYKEVWENIYFNTKRNIYFALHFSEGKFYTIQKIWIALTLFASLIFLKKDRSILFGVITLCSILIFNLVLYKNYDWAELRMYTPLCIFLNLAILSSNRNFANGLIGLNLLSFLLVIPLVDTLIYLRINQETMDIPSEVSLEIENLSEPLILVDSVLLQNYSLSQLPIMTSSGKMVRYILPYYEMSIKSPTHFLKEENGQIKVSKAKILTQ